MDLKHTICPKCDRKEQPDLYEIILNVAKNTSFQTKKYLHLLEKKSFQAIKILNELKHNISFNLNNEINNIKYNNATISDLEKLLLI